MSAPSPAVKFPGLPLPLGDDLSGELFYVDGTNGDDDYPGDKQYPKKTLSGANDACVADRGDVVAVLPGAITLTAAFAPVAGVRFRAAIIRPYPTVTIQGSIASFVTLEANQVVFEGFRFLASADAVSRFFLIADTVNVYGFGLYRCVFDAGGRATVKAIEAADAVYGLKYSLIRDNHFGFGFDTSVIDIGVLGMTGTKILNNFICVTDGATGINLADTGAITVGAEAQIAFNLFAGQDITPDDEGITIAGTENVTALVAIHDNRYTYLSSTPVTQDKISYALVNNYVGDAATGGTLVDPGT